MTTVERLARLHHTQWRFLVGRMIALYNASADTLPPRQEWDALRLAVNTRRRGIALATAGIKEQAQQRKARDVREYQRKYHREYRERRKLLAATHDAAELLARQLVINPSP